MYRVDLVGMMSVSRASQWEGLYRERPSAFGALALSCVYTAVVWVALAQATWGMVAQHLAPPQTAPLPGSFSPSQAHSGPILCGSDSSLCPQHGPGY